MLIGKNRYEFENDDLLMGRSYEIKCSCGYKRAEKVTLFGDSLEEGSRRRLVGWICECRKCGKRAHGTLENKKGYERRIGNLFRAKGTVVDGPLTADKVIQE